MSTALVYALWVVAPAMQSVIGWRMWVRRLFVQYPFFFTYTVSHVLLFFPVGLYSYASGQLQLYRLTYAVCEAMDVLLKVGVICELFVHLFRPYQGIRGLGSVLLRWGGVILLLVAVLAAASTGGSDSDKFLGGLFALERSLEIMQGGLLLLLFILSFALGLKWNYEALGIAIGFGLITGVHLAAFTLRVQFGAGTTDLLSLVASAGYDCAVLVWLVALRSRSAVHQFDQRIPAWDVESWNRALLNLLRQ